MEVPPNLLKDEKIIKSIKPKPRLKGYWFLSWGLGLIFAWAIILAFIFLELGANLPISIFGTIIAFLIVLATFLLLLLIILLRYHWECYWITNKRIITRTGLIGYRYYSVPLERISDVIVRKDWLERIFKLGSLHFQTLAGQLSKSGLGAETRFLGLENSEELQKTILELIEAKRKREKLSF
ncbi:MAG: PH domain-containing protein [Candidatus Pacearchaeota archaeon]